MSVHQTKLLVEIEQFEDAFDIASLLLQETREPSAVVFESQSKHLLQSLSHGRIYKYKKSLGKIKFKIKCTAH